ncbi:hypothetical protein [Fimbriimonas ginsengisoli]|uniref:Uncharacterized protein n=1 Tax=Fimbriimonas ginsengisoli Gsoil 348 TaxID=661478 RepID=A0A068NRX3_FIMGI|nr:hypothetical protein [Fimbriimonas ginsengisoli]AIE85510.1 hypothetical protein OP10G_2142 [Fimbriimonas ginsengisoli Gsoil 348]
MNTLMERPMPNSAVNCAAITRAVAKARLGDEVALRWLMDQRTAGSVVAARALEDLQRAMAKTA